MLTGINHIALLTSDMDRFIAFYTEVFGAMVVLDATEGDLRHAMLDIGGGAALHPFFVAENPHGRGSPEMFARGHLDHLALNAYPDGMDCEIAVWKEGEPLSFEDRVLEPYPSQA